MQGGLTLVLLSGCVSTSERTADTISTKQSFISIGTGGITGVYYPSGGSICRLVNESRKKQGVRCSAESTRGSISNINAIRAGELQFGISQSDWQYHAYHGTSKFSTRGAYRELRSLFSLYPEPGTIIAREDSGIKNITDLKGKRVNIGQPGYGTRHTWEVLEKRLGWLRTDLALATELSYAESGIALCNNKIDAIILMLGPPSNLTQETLSSCASHLVHADTPEIDELVADELYYPKLIS